MDSRQLEYVVAVAEELSFSRAARRLYAAQSTVSAGVRALETELGAALFERTSRQVRLTPTGEAFLPEARDVLAAMARARTAASDAASGLRGSVRLGTISHLGFLDLPAALGAFHRRHPGVDVQVRVSPTGSTGHAEDLRRGLLDVALVGLPPGELPGLDVTVLARTAFTLVVPLGHRLAGRRSAGLADLADEHFVDSPAGFGNRISVDQAFRAARISRRVAVEVPDVPGIADHVAEGLGVAVVPDFTDLTGKRVVAVPLVANRLSWTLAVATRSGTARSPAVAAVLQALLENARSEPSGAPGA